MNKPQQVRVLKNFSLMAFVVFVFVSLGVVRVSTIDSGARYYSVNAVPAHRVALVLGTSPFASDGSDNVYFTARMEGARDLYFNGKVQKILLSGDNRTDHYNEPEKMRRALISMGVASSSLVLDYAGRDTLDSILRARDIFGVIDPIIVTQRFHADRALAMALFEGMNAVAYIVPENSRIGTRVKLYGREYFARVKMFIELALSRDMHIRGDRRPIY